MGIAHQADPGPGSGRQADPGPGSAHQADPRAAYLTELVDLVWPAPAGTTLYRAGIRSGPPTGSSPGDLVDRYAVVPSAARPRLLVPVGSARAAASAVRHATEAAGPKARVRQRLLSLAFRTGIGPLAFRDRVTVHEAMAGAGSAGTAGPAAATGPVGAAGTAGSGGDTGGLAGHLARLLDRPLLVSLHIGPPRANRKPVLQLLAPDGTVLGFAKLGVDPLTRSLVDAEAAALARLAGLPLPGMAVPGVLHHGPWRDHALLVQSALPVGSPRAAPHRSAAAELAAMRTVSACLGVRPLAVAGSPYAHRLTGRITALGDRPEAARLHRALAVLAGAAPVLSFGAWHGDWNGGNSAVLADGRVLVWDWERFAADVPVGYDALHRALQTSITRAGVDPRAAARTLLDTAPGVLAPFGTGPAQAGPVAVLYLIELATRYLTDRQAEAGARLGRVETWLLPVVEEYLEGIMT